jgi:hypothetical protein
LFEATDQFIRDVICASSHTLSSALDIPAG